MELTLTRKWFTDVSTISDLLIDGHFTCYGLEDTVREIPGEPVETWKVHGKTAIPQGCYQVVITPSQRFKCDLPLLVDVPGFAGVRIHSGNVAENTEGCILVGVQRAADRVGQSRDAMAIVFEKLKSDRGPIWITVSGLRDGHGL